MMLKSRLATGLVITIVMLSGILYFNGGSSPISAGQIVTLSLGALAWLALFLFSDSATHSLSPNVLVQQQSLQNHLAQAPQDDTNGFSSHYAELLSTMQTELGSQISATEAELQQVKSLMDSAIDDLVDSFISLEASTRIEQKLVMLLAANETVSDKDELNPFREKQLKSKQLLQETGKKLNTLIQDAKLNETALQSLTGAESDTEKALKKLEDSLEKVTLTTHSELVSKVRERADVLRTSFSKANDVTTKLLASSKTLTEESKNVSHKIGAIIDENINNIAMVAEEMTLVSQQIEKDVQLAVKSLQFQDMTTQLITQCGERLKVMQDMLNAINLFSHNSAEGDSAYVLQTKLSMARDKLKQTSTNVRMKQFNVDAGHVELFD